MRKLFVRILYVLLVVAGLISCSKSQKDLGLQKSPSLGSLNDIQCFLENNYTELEKYLAYEIELNWAETVEHPYGDWCIWEVPCIFQDEIPVLRIMAEEPYTNNIEDIISEQTIRLLIVYNIPTGHVLFYKSYTIPFEDCRNHFSSNIIDNNLSEKSNDFCGIELIYTIDNRYVAGTTYQNGLVDNTLEVVYPDDFFEEESSNSIVPEKPASNNIQSIPSLKRIGEATCTSIEICYYYKVSCGGYISDECSNGCQTLDFSCSIANLTYSNQNILDHILLFALTDIAGGGGGPFNPDPINPCDKLHSLIYNPCVSNDSCTLNRIANLTYRSRHESEEDGYILYEDGTYQYPIDCFIDHILYGSPTSNLSILERAHYHPMHRSLTEGTSCILSTNDFRALCTIIKNGKQAKDFKYIVTCPSSTIIITLSDPSKFSRNDYDNMISAYTAFKDSLCTVPIYDYHQFYHDYLEGFSNLDFGFSFYLTEYDGNETTGTSWQVKLNNDGFVDCD